MAFLRQQFGTNSITLITLTNGKSNQRNEQGKKERERERVKKILIIKRTQNKEVLLIKSVEMTNFVN